MPTAIAFRSGVAGVAILEIDLAADGRHAHAVAVERDPADDVLEEISVAGVIEAAESKAVEARDRPRAHREDVSQYSPHARRRALERLDRRWMVVAFDLHDDAIAVADVDHTGVLQPRALDSLFILLEVA